MYCADIEYITVSIISHAEIRMMRLYAARPAALAVSPRILRDGNAMIIRPLTSNAARTVPTTANVLIPGARACMNCAWKRSSLEMHTQVISTAIAATESRSLLRRMLPSMVTISRHLAMPPATYGITDMKRLRNRSIRMMHSAMSPQLSDDVPHRSAACTAWTVSSPDGRLPCTKASAAGLVCSVSTDVM